MERMEVKPILARKIEHFNAHNKSRWNTAFAEIQNVLNLYKATGLPVLQNEELRSLFMDTINVLYNKLASGKEHLLTVGGTIEVDKEIAISVIKKSDRFDGLIGAINSYTQNGAKHYTDAYGKIGFSIYDMGKYFRLDAEGNLQFTQEHLVAMEDHGNQYIKTQKGQDVYKFTQGIVALYFTHNMDKHLPRKGKISIEALTDYLCKVMQGIDLEKKEVIIEMQGIKGYYADGV